MPLSLAPDDPELPPGTLRHRSYLTRKDLFKEVYPSRKKQIRRTSWMSNLVWQVIPFNNDAVVKRIHQSFRFTYLKDVALPRYFLSSST